MFQFKKTVFVEVSAPSRANFTMRWNADENGEDLPQGVKAVYQNFYMDDGLPSTDFHEKAIKMRKQMTELLHHGGFCLHKWLTNDPDILQPSRSKIDLHDSSNWDKISYQQTELRASFGMPSKICCSWPDWRMIQVRGRGRSWAKHSLFGVCEDFSSHSQ